MCPWDQGPGRSIGAMSPAHPFVHLPSERGDWRTFVDDYVSQRLAAARSTLEAIAAGGAPDALAAWNEADSTTSASRTQAPA